MIFAVFMTLVTFSAINLLGLSDYLVAMFDHIGFLFYNADLDFLRKTTRSISVFLDKAYVNEFFSAIATIPFARVYFKLSLRYE